MEQETLESSGRIDSSGSLIRPSVWRCNTAILMYMALGTVVLHAIVGNRYGFHCDELATLEDARHLAWGYPAYPPVTPFFGRLSLILFGTSLAGFRFFASLAHASTVVMAGWMAREMGGKREAQILAGAAALPFCIGGGALMQYVSFDYAAWVVTAYFIIRLLATGDPRWWVAVGAGIGFGMLSKYTMAFFVVAIIAGLLLTNARRFLKSKWLWIGAVCAVLLFLPNLIWQAQHQFVSLDFLKHIHARDVRQGSTRMFLPAQLEFPYFPLVVAGLYFYLHSCQGKLFRMVGWMYVITFLLFAVARGKHYYLYPAYPMLYAAGAVWGEEWVGRLRPGRAVTIRWTAWSWLASGAVVTMVFFLPIAPVNSGWWKISSALQETYRSEFGWRELVQEVARIRDSLPPEERARLGILGTTYGETGAINLFGPPYGLPRAISGINSFWQRGYGDPAPRTLIVIGQSREFLDLHFEKCKLAGHQWNRYGIKNDEMIWNPDIFVCGPPKQGWPDFWKGFRYFG
jgi:lipoprotein signal peptidase